MIREHSASEEERKLLGRIRRLAIAVVRISASLKLTVVLVAHLAAALACGAYLERTYGFEFARWHVYGSRLLIGLLAALAVNIAAGAIVRFPQRRSQAGRLVAPAGLVVLLAGFIYTLVQGVEGHVVLWKGGTAQAVMLTGRSRLVLLARRGGDVDSTELGFSPGPADWREGEPLDFGDVGGMEIKVLQFLRYAKYHAGWIADETGASKPAIRVLVPDTQTGASVERWCVPVLFGSRPVPGQLDLSIEQAAAASLRDDFLKPPALKPGTRGVLSAHYKDHVYPIPVDGNTGKQIPVGTDGVTVEIVDYHADAKVDKGKFVSEGAEPKNPMLQLRVHVPGQQQPISEIAYANRPFVTFGTIHRKQDCPVKFWYHHPAATVASGAEFVQTPDGKLYCRAGDGRAWQWRGEVHEGDRISLSADRQVTLLRYFPHARPESKFVPVELAPGETTDAEAAVLVEVTAGEKSEQFWLGRDDPRFGVRQVQSPDGPRLVVFGYASSPLGFSVKLVELQKETDPDSPSDVSYVSQVQFFEPTQDPEVVSADHPLEEIATGRPLKYGTFTFHQSDVRELPGAYLSVLRVTSDPGWLLKWSGAAIFCAGVLLSLCAWGMRPARGSSDPAQGPTEGLQE
jgi:hypothetical protein